MTCRHTKIIQNQRGSVINVALLILILIFLIGIGLSKMSTTDIKIASNIKTKATTFYETEAGLEGISELVELNVACPRGFKDTPTATDGLPAGWERIEGTFMVTDLDFWRNEAAGDPTDIDNDPTTDDRDPKTNTNIVAYYVGDPDLGDNPDAVSPEIKFDPFKPHTSFSLGGPTRFSKGSAIQMAAGYEGLGKGAGAGGASMIYDVFAKRYGAEGTEAMHMIQWIHILGLGGTCQYD